MARNICKEDLSKYNGSPVTAPAADILLLQKSNLNTYTKIDTNAKKKEPKGLKKLLTFRKDQTNKTYGRSHGNEIALYLTRQFHDIYAPADIKNMMTEAKKSYQLLQDKYPFLYVYPGNVDVEVRFFDNNNPDPGAKGTGINPYNFFFNLDLVDRTQTYNKHHLNQEIVTITFHTDIDDSAVTSIGAFHVRDKSNPYDRNKHKNFIRIRICKDAATGEYKLSKVYTEKGGNINHIIVDPFLQNFIVEFEHYLNTGFTTRNYVSLYAPVPVPPVPVPAPVLVAPGPPPVPIGPPPGLVAPAPVLVAPAPGLVAPVPPPAPGPTTGGRSKKPGVTRKRKQRKTRKNRTAYVRGK